MSIDETVFSRPLSFQGERHGTYLQIEPVVERAYAEYFRIDRAGLLSKGSESVYCVFYFLRSRRSFRFTVFIFFFTILITYYNLVTTNLI